MRGVPVAMIIKTAGLFQDARQFHATRAHVVNVGFGGFVAVIKGALLFCFAPENFVVAVGVERRVDVNEINASRGKFLELFQVIAAINNARVEEGAWLRDGFARPHPVPLPQGEGDRVSASLRLCGE